MRCCNILKKINVLNMFENHLIKQVKGLLKLPKAATAARRPPILRRANPQAARTVEDLPVEVAEVAEEAEAGHRLPVDRSHPIGRPNPKGRIDISISVLLGRRRYSRQRSIKRGMGRRRTRV